MATYTLAASPTTSGAATLALSVVSVASLSASPITYGVGVAELAISSTVTLAASPTTFGVGSLDLAVSSIITLAASPITYGVGSMNLVGGSDTHGMSLCEMMSDIMSLWGIHCRKNAPAFVIARALSDINSAIQMVWNQADERSYWSSSTLTIEVGAGAASVDLDDDIQNVVGPCRVSDTKRPLVPIGTIGELESFSNLYLDGETSTESLAYHIERANQAGNEPVKLVFMVTPVCDEAQEFLLDVVKEAPRYSEASLIDCPLIPIPHQYVETLLLPIARYNASSFEMFKAADMKETIDRAYIEAMKALGMADPLPGKAGDKFDLRKEPAK